MDLSQDILGLFAGDALQWGEGGRVSSSVQVIVDHGVPSTLLPHCFFLFRLACAILQVLDDGCHPIIHFGLVYC